MPAHAGVKQLLSKDHRQTSLGVLGLLAVPGPGVLELCPAPLSAGAPTAPFSLLTSAQPLVLGPPCPTSSLRAPAPESRPPSDQRSCYGTEVTLTQPPVQTSRPGAGSLTKLSLSASCTLGWPRCFRPPGNRQGPTPPVQTSRAVIAGWSRGPGMRCPAAGPAPKGRSLGVGAPGLPCPHIAGVCLESQTGAQLAVASASAASETFLQVSPHCCKPDKGTSRRNGARHPCGRGRPHHTFLCTQSSGCSGKCV